MVGSKARLFAQNFDAVLVVIVISAGDATFAKFHNKLLKHVNYTFQDIGDVVFLVEAVF